MPLMAPDLSVETYIRVLIQVRGIVSAWEAQLALQATGIAAELASHRARLPLIDADLDWFGLKHSNHAECELPRFATEAQLLGAMYVMEGSRLGGQLIAKHVESHLGFERGEATHYFRGFEDRTGAMWKQFLEVLGKIVPDESTHEVILGAKNMFAAFGAWMRNIRQ